MRAWRMGISQISSPAPHGNVDRLGARIKDNPRLATLQLPEHLRNLLIKREVPLAIFCPFTQHERLDYPAQGVFRQLGIRNDYRLRIFVAAVGISVVTLQQKLPGAVMRVAQCCASGAPQKSRPLASPTPRRRPAHGRCHLRLAPEVSSGSHKAARVWTPAARGSPQPPRL